MADITLQQAQQMVDSWIKTYGVRLFQWAYQYDHPHRGSGRASPDHGTYLRWAKFFKESDKHRDLGDEMADVLWVLLCLANQTGVDLTAAFEKNLQKKNRPR